MSSILIITAISALLLFYTLFEKKSALLLNGMDDQDHLKSIGDAHSEYSVKTLSLQELENCEEIPDTYEQFLDKKHYQLFIKKNPQIFRKLKKNPLILVNGEKTIQADQKISRTLLYLAYIARRFLYKHVQMSSFQDDPQTSINPEVQKMYKEVLHYCSMQKPSNFTLSNSKTSSASL